ncbi:MAG: hypothetical protein FWD35_02905 [Oscillospiraceae bacterium]|nr:hypothetical protein [Oscillospiraceae bacterium]
MTNQNKLPADLSQSRKFPWAGIFFPAALILLTVIRYYQFANVITPQNGFFVNDGGLWNHAFYIAFAVASAGFLALAILDKRAGRGVLSSWRKQPKPPKGVKKSDAPEIALPKTSFEFSLPVALIGALPLMYCGGAVILEVFYRNAANGVERSMIPFVLLALAGLGYTFAAYSFIAHRKLAPVVAIAFLFIAAHNASEAALEFMTRSYIANVSTRLVVISVFLLFATFLLSAGRVIVKSETQYTLYTTTLSGYLAASLILSEFAARLWYFFAAEESLRNTLTEYAPLNGFELPDAFFVAQGLFALWLMYVLSTKGRISEEDDDTQDKLEQLLLQAQEEADAESAPRNYFDTEAFVPDSVDGGTAD